MLVFLLFTHSFSPCLSVPSCGSSSKRTKKPYHCIRHFPCLTMDFRKSPKYLLPTTEPASKMSSASEILAFSKPLPAVCKMEHYPSPIDAPPLETKQRPQLMRRVPSIQTRYMEMLLHLDRIPRLHNVLAAVFTWILLAGFLVIPGTSLFGGGAGSRLTSPGTFTSFKNSETFKNADSGESSAIEAVIARSIAHIGLLWVSGACCLIGALGVRGRPFRPYETG